MNTLSPSPNLTESGYGGEGLQIASSGIENTQALQSEGRIVGELIKSRADRLTKIRQNARKMSGVSNEHNVLPDTRRTTAGRAVTTSEEWKCPKIQMDVVNRPKASLSPLQEWEGYVTDVTNSHAIVNLLDITAGETRANDRAEIPLEEFAESDIPKLSPGRVLRWVIGYQRSPSGTKMRVSQIVVRDLPRWTARELREAKAEAVSLSQFFAKE